MNTPRDVSYDDTLLPILKDPLEAAAYIEAVRQLNEPATLQVALHYVVKTQDMAAATHI